MNAAAPAVIAHPSPNFGARRGAPVDLLVLHYTDLPTLDAALAILTDPARAVSAHYLIAADGRIFQLVAEGQRAWHAGEAYWGGVTDVNSRSIGIELDNPGH
ncbi:MAG: N-acetylmuramoyl-L-alanine amidase, partial [Thalassobaculaceae bacterium]